MIFVTVGAQMPFDRLVRTIDVWTCEQARDDVFAQIAESKYQPRHMRCTSFLDPRQYREHIKNAQAVIAHAGMGSIIAALQFARPIVILPRRVELGETRNNHQVATMRQFAQVSGVSIAHDEYELSCVLSDIDNLPAPTPASAHASFRLLSTIRRFIMDEGTEQSGEAAMTRSTSEHLHESRRFRPARSKAA